MALTYPFVSSHGLRRQILVCDGEPMELITLLPFFDSAGCVHQVVVVNELSGELRIFDPRDSTFRRIFLKRNVLSATPPVLRAENLPKIRHLWSFDPWNTFQQAPLGGRDIPRRLAQSNAFGSLRRKRRNAAKLFYRYDLTRVTWAACTSNRQSEIVPFKACLLPPAPEWTTPEASATAKTRHWRLKPFWVRHGA